MITAYPLKFHPVYRPKIWGGKKLKEKYNRNLPSDQIGESWEISARQEAVSIIKNGPLKGQNLIQLFESKQNWILGKAVSPKNKFPLLIKFLDATSKLSVQVHPDRKFAQEKTQSESKTEMWYILDAEPEAEIVYGLKSNTTKNKLKKAIKQGNLDKHLNKINVKKGDIIFIPGGMVHALEEGILLAEIQQNSDTTYRLYDWNRKDENGNSRTLHVQKGIAAIKTKLNKNNSLTQPELFYQDKNYQSKLLTACPYFVVEKFNLNGIRVFYNHPKRFNILMCLKGEITVDSNNHQIQLNSAETCLLPGKLSKIKIKGKGQFLQIYPPLDKDNLFKHLKKYQPKKEQLNHIPGINMF